MNTPKLMQCGCAVYPQSDGRYICVVHYGIKPEATIINDSPPDLFARSAQCSCGLKEPSNLNLPFFKYEPNYKVDSFYCGHAGWN
jgi:hypothetical protein